jgi:hypothetical protein
MKRQYYQRHKERMGREAMEREMKDEGRYRSHNLIRHIPLDKGIVCEECGSSEQLERHHPDYKSLNVQILCKPCHSKYHRGVTF